MQYLQMFTEMEFWGVFLRSLGVGNLSALLASQDTSVSRVSDFGP